MSQPTILRSLWLKWKSLKLPWRRKWLVGTDLSGIQFYEFLDPLNPARPRRIAQYPTRTHHSDVHLTPAWHQWLRHTRPGPPSITEQQHEVTRQQNLKLLAAEADRRWAEKPSYLDKPEEYSQPGPELQSRDPAGYGRVRRGEEGEMLQKEMESSGVSNAVEGQEEVQRGLEGEDVRKGRFKGEETRERTREEKRVKEKDPWAKAARSAPGEGWQPESWVPPKVQRRG